MTAKNQSATRTPSQETVEPEGVEQSDCIIDHEDDIDWDEIIATTEEDFKAGRYAFNSANYATRGEAMEAMNAWIDSIADEVMRGVASDTALHAKS